MYRRVNHSLHGFLFVITFGMYLPVWLTVVMVVGMSNSDAANRYYIQLREYNWARAQWEWYWQNQRRRALQRQLGELRGG